MKVTVVLPAYQAASTLERTVNDIPRDSVDEILLVDDSSTDATVEIAQRLGLIVHRHERNRGYGGNQKTCYTMALERGADIVVMLHPDYQYDATLIKYFVEFIRDDRFDVMLGSRIRSRRDALAGGMPPYKYFFNRALTVTQNMATGLNLSEWHTGMRAYRRGVLDAYRRGVLERIRFMENAEGFVFDSQVLFQIVEAGFRIGEIPVPVRYNDDSSSINLRNSLAYGAGTLRETARFLARKITGPRGRARS